MDEPEVEDGTRTDPLDPVFISYRQSDGMELALALAWALRAAGVPVWHDQTDLPPGDTRRRLAEALASGLSAAILLVTPDIAKSDIVRDIELPSLLALAGNPAFTLSIASTIEKANDPGHLDYRAPDELLQQEPGTLAALDQALVATSEQRADIARALCRRRMEQLRDGVTAAGGTMTLDIQTRVPPYAAMNDAHLVLRLRPPVDGERRPHVDGLRDLQNFLGQLPQLFAISGASLLRVRGGAHLSVACALGAALPTTLVGAVEVVDTRGEAWVLVGQSPGPSNPPLVVAVAPPRYNHEHGPVLAYIDLLPQRSDAAHDRFIADAPAFAGTMHLRAVSDDLLAAGRAADLVGGINAAIRDLANIHQTTTVHLLLRCPYPVALLLGRTMNTLTVHLYEWEDGGGPDAAAGTPRYLPSVILRTGAGGSPIDQVTAPLLSAAQ